MLNARLAANPRASARASHSIRTTTSDQDWLDINSTNVDDIVSRPLPAPERQLTNLVALLKGLAGDAHLAEIDIEHPEMLTAAVGTVDESSLMRLAEWAMQDGWIVVSSGGKKMALTPKAWAGAEGERPAAITVEETKPELIKTARGHCPSCGPDRRAEIKGSHEERWEDDSAQVWGYDTYNILKCSGCDAVYIQHENLFSEDIDYVQDIHGNWEQIATPTTQYWPSPARRPRPDWLTELEDDTLRSVLSEVYGALDADHRILAAIGARTSLDRAMVLLGATSDNFPLKLSELEEKGIVSPHEKEQLLVLTDAGSASAHRAWHPSVKHMDTVMSGMESFLNRTLIFGKEISAVRRDIPLRPKPPKGGKSPAS